MKNCIVLFCLIVMVLSSAGCKKSAPAGPAANTATVTGTSTPVHSPTITGTHTVSPTATDTCTVTETATCTGTATSTITPTITPLETVGSVITGVEFSFSAAGEIGSWYSNGNPITGRDFEITQYYDPPGSMRLSWNGALGSGSSVGHNLPAARNLSNHVLSFYIKCPPEMAGYKITFNLGTMTGGTGQDIGYIDGSGGWQHFTWNLAANPPCCVADPSQSTGIAIGINRNGNPQVGSANIYIDSVDLDY
jgi:hypothetical protein